MFPNETFKTTFGDLAVTIDLKGIPYNGSSYKPWNGHYSELPGNVTLSPENASSTHANNDLQTTQGLQMTFDDQTRVLFECAESGEPSDVDVFVAYGLELYYFGYSHVLRL